MPDFLRIRALESLLNRHPRCRNWPFADLSLTEIDICVCFTALVQ